MDLFDLVAKITLDKSDYDKGLDEAEDEGKGFGDKLKGAFGTVAKAGVGLAAGASAAGAAIYGMATKSAATSDRIDKMSQKMGLSRKTFQEFDFIASQSGTSVNVLRGGMKTLTKQMSSAQSGTKKSKEAFEQLGISVTDANGNMRDQEDVLFDVINSLQNMEDGTEKATLASQLLGRAGTDMMPLLNGAAGSMEEMRQQAHDLGLVIEDDVIDAGVKFTDTVDQLQRSFSTIATKVGAEVMPIVQKAMDFIIAHMPEIQAAVSKVFGYLEGFVTWVVGIGTKYIMPALTGIIDLVKGVFTGEWKGAWESLKGAFQNIWSGLSGWFAGVWEKVKSAVFNVDWAQVGTDIIKKIKAALGAIVEWATEWYNSLADAINAISWEDVGNTIWDGISSAFNAVFTFFQNLFSDTKTGIENGIDWLGLGNAIWNYIKAAFGAVATTFLTIFNRAKDTIAEIHWGEMASSVWEKIKSGFSAVTSWFAVKFQEGLEAIKSIGWADMASKVWEAIKTGFTAVTSWLASTFQKGLDTIRNNVDWAGLGSTIWDFIKTGFSAVASWLASTFQKGLEAIKNIKWEDMGRTVWGFIKTGFSAVASWLASTFQKGLEAIKNVSWAGLGKTIWEAIKTGFAAVTSWLASKFQKGLEAIRNIPWRDLGEQIWSFIKNALLNAGAWFRQKFTEAWSAVKLISWSELGLAIWNWITDSIRNVGTKFKGWFDEAVMLVKSIKWADVGQAIWDGITGAIAGIGEWIKSQLTFDPSNIHIPTPHFKYTTSKIFGFNVPDFTIEWYKKGYNQPFAFDQPTVMPLAGFGDGVGKEIVMSDRKLSEIAGNSETVMAIRALTKVVEDINDSLSEKMAVALTQMGFNIDEREFARLVRRTT